MRRTLRGCLFVMLLLSVVVFLYACGEKHTFQVSDMETPYTNVKLASVDGANDVMLDEDNTKKCMSLFDGLIFEQTQSGGKFTDKSYSLIFMNGEKAVDSMQFSEDGKTIAYGGYFYQLKEETYNSEQLLLFFEEQKAMEEQKKPAEAAKTDEETGTENETESVPESETEGQRETKEEQPDEIFAGEEFDGQFPEDSRIAAIRGGYSCRIDLDGDGEKEEVLYEVQSADGVHAEVLFALGTVLQDGMLDYSATMNWKNGESLPFADLIAPCAGAYWVADLDSTDSYYEIVFLDYGEREDPVYHFIRYEEGELVYLGEIPSDSGLTIKGDGKVTASGRLSILQSWNAPFTWILEDEKLQHPEEEWYYPYVNAAVQQNTKQVKGITVYAEADLESEKVTVEPSEDVVTFGTTDNKNWVQFFRADGISGWIYLKDGMYIEAEGEEYFTWEVFEDLYLVG